MSNTIGQPISIDVALCGAVPRHHCQTNQFPSTDRPSGSDTSDAFVDVTQKANNRQKAMRPTLAQIRSKIPNRCVSSTEKVWSQLTIQPSSSGEETVMTRRPAITMLEPPQWAVSAKGETRLVPIGDALDTHGAVDLTRQPFFRIGRSPASDVQLMHNTSSRRHAMIFHHPNGSCYVVDCGSSHGTFVNGVRVRNASSGSMVVPHRVKRGSLIRFGGPGAPSFVLKSFSVGFSSMIKELHADDCCLLAPSRPRDSLVQINTRLNCYRNIAGSILKKRSFDDHNIPTTIEPPSKRRRCVSPTWEPPSTELRLVSPDSPRKRVTFREQTKPLPPSAILVDESSDDDSKN